MVGRLVVIGLSLPAVAKAMVGFGSRNMCPIMTCTAPLCLADPTRAPSLSPRPRVSA